MFHQQLQQDFWSHYFQRNIINGICLKHHKQDLEHSQNKMKDGIGWLFEKSTMSCTQGFRFQITN